MVLDFKTHFCVWNPNLKSQNQACCYGVCYSIKTRFETSNIGLPSSIGIPQTYQSMKNISLNQVSGNNSLYVRICIKQSRLADTVNVRIPNVRFGKPNEIVLGLANRTKLCSVCTFFVRFIFSAKLDRFTIKGGNK